MNLRPLRLSLVCAALLLCSCERVAVDTTAAMPSPAVTTPSVTIAPMGVSPEIVTTSGIEYELELDILSRYAILYNVTDDTVLYQKNALNRCYPASTTKLLSSVVVYDNLDEDDTVTVTEEALSLVQPHSSLAFLSADNVLTRRQIVGGMLLPSGNDAAYTAAYTIGKSLLDDPAATPQNCVDRFIAEMNATAEKIGMTSTHFSAPDGYHRNDHYTTAYDMLKLCLYCASYPELCEIASTDYMYENFVSGELANWKNSNSLVCSDTTYYYPYANGMKTGMTDEAGHCVAASAEFGGKKLICIVLGADTSPIRWTDTIGLFNYGFDYLLGSEYEEYWQEYWTPTVYLPGKRPEDIETSAETIPDGASGFTSAEDSVEYREY